ncbi:hypothetical protein RJ639_018016 [Escallonia herrerae]|uniref:CC-NBS-LRR protein n=1 Tax=Escallonia herrerae TaxID=1293975 RepID=A0AA88V715_9ASTE|nr:hypothetical protein RJ639_018016 [Escallonia herrerae]
MEPDSKEMWLHKSVVPSPLLESINISGWANPKFLPWGLLQSFTSLERLEIEDCPKFRSLSRGLLPTLSSLVIKECPLLQRRCSKEKRDYWPLIANIPQRGIGR